MTERNPWAKIGTPSSEFTVRRVAEQSRLPIYWGRDTAGRYLFVIGLEGNHVTEFRAHATSLKGIEVDLRQFDSASDQGLVLILESQTDSDLFHSLCLTLVESVKDVEDSSTALRLSLSHLKRWKAFLAGKKGRLLSAEEVRGLFAELLFLRSLYKQYVGQREAVDGWQGPIRAHQDFALRDSVVEIKAISARERSCVRISSEDQLESQAARVYLQIFRLVELPDSDQSLSLNDLVRQIGKELTDAKTVQLYWERLAAYGYAEMLEYDEPKFVVGGTRTYRVSEDFPRLIRSQIPDGVSRVSYDIRLEKIEKFACDKVTLGEEKREF